MTRIEPLALDNAPEAARPLLEGVRGKLGRVPNLFATLAHSPAALGAYLGLSQTLAGGVFDAGERELVALAVAQRNRCDYCLAAHTAIGKMSGLDAGQMSAARDGRPSDARHAALVDLTRTLVENRGGARDEELEAFRAAGWSDAHLLELVALVAMNTFTNYVNHVARTEVDFPAAPALG